MLLRSTIIVCIVLSSVQCDVAAPKSYLACSGYSGTAAMQSILPIENRTITADKSAINGSIAITGKQIEVEGIPLMTGVYDICESSDQSLLFAPACYPGQPDKFGDFGVLNKVTGNVRYHVGDALFMLSCHKAEKVLK
jgi:hypothetical protein